MIRRELFKSQTHGLQHFMNLVVTSSNTAGVDETIRKAFLDVVSRLPANPVLMTQKFKLLCQPIFAFFQKIPQKDVGMARFVDKINVHEGRLTGWAIWHDPENADSYFRIIFFHGRALAEYSLAPRHKGVPKRESVREHIPLTVTSSIARKLTLVGTL